jgi:PleD family two-component response regulator
MPSREEQNDTPAASNQAPEAERRLPSPPWSRVLIVEDDYFVSLQIEHALRSAGFNVVGLAATQEEARCHSLDFRDRPLGRADTFAGNRRPAARLDS